MSCTLRFAPSPTGRIHIGNARTALFNWLYARQNDGRFILRYDDTDRERSRQEYADAIAVDLEWLGIRPDRVEHQSRRLDRYEAAAARLRDAGLLYACFETAEDLERRRKLRLARRLPPVYGREALRLSEAERAKLVAEGRRPHWRFRLPNFEADPFEPRRTEVVWDDMVRGRQVVDLASLSDPVLVREDGTFLYTFTSVVDDAEMDVSHVIRGEDHVTNTGVQIALFEALGARVPIFGHHNLLVTASGEGLSKRTGALSLASLRESGIEPMAVASLAVLTGTSENVSAMASMDDLAKRFDIAATSRGAARFDPADLDHLNRALLQSLDFEAVRDRLGGLGIDGARAQPFWLAVRGNIDRFDDVAQWWSVVTIGALDEEGPEEIDLAFLRTAFDQLPAEPWDGQTWKRWTDAIKASTGRKGRELFMPLRLALTGRRSGPELADLLPLFGREGTLARRP